MYVLSSLDPLFSIYFFWGPVRHVLEKLVLGTFMRLAVLGPGIVDLAILRHGYVFEQIVADVDAVVFG